MVKGTKPKKQPTEESLPCACKNVSWGKRQSDQGLVSEHCVCENPSLTIF